MEIVLIHFYLQQNQIKQFSLRVVSWVKVLLHLLQLFSTVKNLREIQHGYDWKVNLL